MSISGPPHQAPRATLRPLAKDLVVGVCQLLLTRCAATATVTRVLYLFDFVPHASTKTCAERGSFRGF